MRDNVALLEISTFDKWFTQIKGSARRKVKKAMRDGVTVAVAEKNMELAKGIWQIYNETPFRQNRGFTHYGASLEDIFRAVQTTANAVYFVAYLKGEFVGFIGLEINGENAVVSNILGLQKHRDKPIVNALIAEMVRYCADHKIESVAYGRMGNHPELDVFKQSNGFRKVELSTTSHQLQDYCPELLKPLAISMYSFVSRAMMHLKLLRRRLL